MVSPLSVTTRCNTPCVEGCCGPMFTTRSSAAPSKEESFNMVVSRYTIVFIFTHLAFPSERSLAPSRYFRLVDGMVRLIVLSYSQDLQNLFAKEIFLPIRLAISTIASLDGL